MAAELGSDIPSASAREFMGVAVPMVLQKPVDGVEATTMRIKPIRSMRPVANNWRAFHMMVPEPTRSPSYQPLSIGPTESAIAGMLTVAAAIRLAGTVLSQPIVSTTPSNG